MDRLKEIVLEHGIWHIVRTPNAVQPKPLGNLSMFSPPKEPKSVEYFRDWVFEGSDPKNPVTFEEYAKSIEANAFERGEGVRIEGGRLLVPFRFYKI